MSGTKAKKRKTKPAQKEVIRFGVSLAKPLLRQFDQHIKRRNYSNRSEAIRDLIRQELVQQDWTAGREVAGTITLVFDHHARELSSNLVRLQHDFQQPILSSQHIHLKSRYPESPVLAGKPG